MRRMIHLFTLLLMPGALQADPRLCDEAARLAAAESGVPAQVLLAITRAETGRRHKSRTEPWPWTLNEAGRGSWYASRADAEHALNRAIMAGQRNIDIGCFQINLRWHGAQFASPADMLPPLTNARYAAKYLTDIYSKNPDWSQAAARYHSHRPDQAAAYLTRLNAVFGDLPAAPPARGGIPLIRSGGFLSAGSFLRNGPGPRPLLSRPLPAVLGR